MPDLDGLKMAKADQQLAEAGLKLGKQNPRPNPNRPIVSQVPSPGEKRPTGHGGRGVPQAAEAGADADAPEAGRRGRAADERPGGRHGGHGGAGRRPAAADGARDRRSRARHGRPHGARRGRSGAADGRVRIVVSAGFPRLAYEGGARARHRRRSRGPRRHGGPSPQDRRDQAVMDPGRPRGRGALPKAGWSSRAPAARGSPTARRSAAPVTTSTSRRSPRAGGDPSWPSSATTPSSAIASASAGCPEPRRAGRRAGASPAGGSASSPGCRTAARCWPRPSRIDGADWRFGLLRLRTDTPFSTRAGDWRGGRSLRTPAQPRRGVAAVAVDPSGRRLALVTSHATSRFQIAITTPDDLALENAKVLPLQGCDVEWRPDGAELAVVQSDNGCTEHPQPHRARRAGTPARATDRRAARTRSRLAADRARADQPCTSSCPGYTTVIGDGGTPSVMPVSVCQVRRLAADEDVERPRARKRRHHGGARLRRGRGGLGAAHDRRADDDRARTSRELRGWSRPPGAG